MNSSHVETDDDQRQWQSPPLLGHTFNFGGAAVDLESTEAQCFSTGYVRYMKLQLDYLRPYGCGTYETQYRRPSAEAWNDPSPNSKALHLEADSNATSSYVWGLPHAATTPSGMFLAPLDYQPMAPQENPAQTLQSPQSTGYFDIGIVSQDSNAHAPLIGATIGPSSNNAELAFSPSTREEKIYFPAMVAFLDGTMPHQQSPRFVGDEYTSSWVHGSGVERVGWCGFCPTWHRLKDSAYWYHMHYSHGISCATGKPFQEPKDWRHKHGITAYEALCGGCDKWVYIGRPERWRTPYFRHAYKCQTKTRPSLNINRTRSKSSSPRKPKLSIRSDSF